MLMMMLIIIAKRHSRRIKGKSMICCINWRMKKCLNERKKLKI